MSFWIDIHSHTLPSQEEEEKICLYNLPFPEKEGEKMIIPEKRASLYFSAGIHPNTPSPAPEWEEQNFRKLLSLLEGKKLLAIGECGMDPHSPLSKEEQMERFQKQVLLSEKYSLPLILHCVHCWEEIFFIRKKCKAEMPWIAHSFRGSPQLAKDLETKGIHPSFAVVFPEKCPRMGDYSFLSRFFLETDESSIDLRHLYRILSEKWKMEEEVLRDKIATSFREVFHVQ